LPHARVTGSDSSSQLVLVTWPYTSLYRSQSWVDDVFMAWRTLCRAHEEWRHIEWSNAKWLVEWNGPGARGAPRRFLPTEPGTTTVALSRGNSAAISVRGPSAASTCVAASAGCVRGGSWVSRPVWPARSRRSGARDLPVARCCSVTCRRDDELGLTSCAARASVRTRRSASVGRCGGSWQGLRRRGSS